MKHDPEKRAIEPLKRSRRFISWSQYSSTQCYIELPFNERLYEVHHEWRVSVPWGVVQLWIKEHPTAPERIIPAGVELHRRVPEKVRQHAGPVPSWTTCHVLRGPCWHDGSSLIAEEKYVPMWKDGASDEQIFAALLSAYENFYPPTE